MNLDSVSMYLLIREEVDLDVIFSKLFIVDICYVYKVGVIGFIVINLVEDGVLVFCLF